MGKGYFIVMGKKSQAVMALNQFILSIRIETKLRYRTAPIYQSKSGHWVAWVDVCGTEFTKSDELFHRAEKHAKEFGGKDDE